MTELEDIAKGYEQLQEQVAVLLQQLEEKGKLISKLFSEKIKFDHQQGELSREKEHNHQAMIQLKKTEQGVINLRRMSESKERQLMMNLVFSFSLFFN